MVKCYSIFSIKHKSVKGNFNLFYIFFAFKKKSFFWIYHYPQQKCLIISNGFGRECMSLWSSLALYYLEQIQQGPKLFYHNSQISSRVLIFVQYFLPNISYWDLHCQPVEPPTSWMLWETSLICKNKLDAVIWESKSI